MYDTFLVCTSLLYLNISFAGIVQSKFQIGIIKYIISSSYDISHDSKCFRGNNNFVSISQSS